MVAKQKLAKLPSVEFVGKVSKMGKNKVIWIPAALHLEMAKFEGKKVKVKVDDDI